METIEFKHSIHNILQHKELLTRGRQERTIYGIVLVNRREENKPASSRRTSNPLYEANVTPNLIAVLMRGPEINEKKVRTLLRHLHHTTHAPPAHALRIDYAHGLRGHAWLRLCIDTHGGMGHTPHLPYLYFTVSLIFTLQKVKEGSKNLLLTSPLPLSLLHYLLVDSTSKVHSLYFSIPSFPLMKTSGCTATAN